MSITSTSAIGTTPAFLNGQTTSAVRAPVKVLGQQDFLTLLATQFKTQDPMKPMEDTSFIAQMAQFTSLQQMSQMSKDQQMLTSASYLGKNVTVEDASGKSTTGQVTAIDNSGAAPSLVINGTSYPLSFIKRIETTQADTTSTPPASIDPASGGTASPATNNLLSSLNTLISNRINQGI